MVLRDLRSRNTDDAATKCLINTDGSDHGLVYRELTCIPRGLGVSLHRKLKSPPAGNACPSTAEAAVCPFYYKSVSVKI